MTPIDPGSGPTPLEIGVGGTFALVLIDKLVALVRALRQNGGNSDKPPAKGVRSRTEDYSVEFDELMRLVRDLHDERREVLEALGDKLEGIRHLISSSQIRSAHDAQ